MPTYGVSIDGVGRPGSGSNIGVVDPSTGRSFSTLAQASTSDVDEAVSAAQSAFHTSGWKSEEPLVRSRVLNRAAERLRMAAPELAEMETRNVGRPLAESEKNVKLAADTLQFYASLTTSIRGATIPMNRSLFDYTMREPIGVCGVIIPWNNPIVLFVRKIAPALATGNAVVAKPSSITPISALAVTEILYESGLPAGLLNVVPGDGADVGHRIVSSSVVRKISFTGSTETGRTIMREAGPRLQRVSLELGGKSPSLIFEDADLNAAVIGSVPAMFANCGQTCTARSRLIVQDSIFERFVSSYHAAIRKLRIGDPFADGTDIGPLITASHRERVDGFISRAQHDGADVMSGGQFRGSAGNLDGFYVEPKLVVNPRHDSEIVTDEVFGPVAVIERFSTEDQAVEMANDTPFGLAASVWTSNSSRAHRLASALEAGTITVNTSKVSHVYAPFGGLKDSGLGIELGVESLDEYLQCKNVVIGVSGQGI